MPILNSQATIYTNTATTTGAIYTWPFTVTSGSSITLTGTNDAVWHQWCDDATSVNANIHTWITWNGQVELRKETRRQREARVRAEQQAQARAEHALKLHAEAQAKAKKLLVEHLTPEQAQTLAEKNYFDVQIGQKTYRIWQGTHGNVRLLDEKGAEKTLYCVQPEGVPAEDAMLAQTLFLKYNEAEFLRLANARQLR